jgi:glycerophosphoryl diester phosphodiesterase
LIASRKTGRRRVGHKGAESIVPGNTIESFGAAAELGVEMIELDVLWTEAGAPRLPVAERAPLIVAHDWGDAAGRDPHTLAEALKAFTRPPLDRVEIDCDLKLPGREYDLVAALHDHGLVERSMVSTMYVESLAAVRALEPSLRLGWTYPKVTKPWDRRRWARPAVVGVMAAMRRRLPQLVERRAPELGAAAVWIFHPLISPRLAEVTAELGVELIAWTVDDPARIGELLAIGVDGIVSNDPRLLAPLTRAPAAGAG